MIWFIIATLVAFFIKGLCGFANTLIFNGISATRQTISTFHRWKLCWDIQAILF